MHGTMKIRCLLMVAASKSLNPFRSTSAPDHQGAGKKQYNQALAGWLFGSCQVRVRLTSNHIQTGSAVIEIRLCDNLTNSSHDLRRIETILSSWQKVTGPPLGLDCHGRIRMKARRDASDASTWCDCVTRP